MTLSLPNDRTEPHEPASYEAPAIEERESLSGPLVGITGSGPLSGERSTAAGQ
jgi:hypothetical protein